jgi:hypothetical protein
VLLPAATVIGNVNPDTEYPVPVTASWVMVSVAVPVLVTVNVWVVDEPAVTLPNDPVAPPTATVVVTVGSVELAPVNPIQPNWVKLTSKAAANNRKIKGLRLACRVWRADEIAAESDSIGSTR